MHDDPDIEVVRLRRESRQGLLTESLRLVRDIILIISAFILVGVFFVQPVVVEGTSMLPQLHDGERLAGQQAGLLQVQKHQLGPPEPRRYRRLLVSRTIRIKAM